MFCTNCGKAMSQGDVFCVECGTKAEQAEVTVQAQQVQTPVGVANTPHPSAAKKSNAKKIAIGAVVVILVLIFVLPFGDSGPLARDPHGLNGRWEDDRGMVLEFAGNRVVQMRYSEWMTSFPITIDDIRAGGYYLFLPSPFGGYMRAHQSPGNRDVSGYEILSQELHIRYNDVWVTEIRRAYGEGTFSISDDRIEIVWQDNRGIQVDNFARTENTINIGNSRYVRN